VHAVLHVERRRPGPVLAQGEHLSHFPADYAAPSGKHATEVSS
jgi:hypothetical protein